MAQVTNVTMRINGQVVATAAYGEIPLPNERNIRLTLHQTNWPQGFRNAIANYLQQPCQINASGPQGTPYNANMTIAGIQADTVNLT